MGSAVLQPGARFCNYELIRMLDAGGMGEVWKASQDVSDLLVAIKFIRPSLLDDPEYKARFLTEAKTLARLEHDRIVPFYGVSEDNGRLALVLRFIDGESLARRIDRSGSLPMNLVLACARDVLPALGFAHEKDIVHRDVKPHNILIDGKEHFLLSDFGIAVAEFAGRQTAAGTSIGTTHYMSPEQIKKPQLLDPHRGGARSDIYSFGVVLFEMLTGRLPFGDRRKRDEAQFVIQNMHCATPAPRLRDFNPDVIPGVEKVVLQCLEKNPDNRPQTCAQLLRMLDEAAASVTAPDPEKTRREDPRVLQGTIPFKQRAATPEPQPAAARVPAEPTFAGAAPEIRPAPARTTARKSHGKLIWFGIGIVALLVAAGTGIAVFGPRDKPIINVTNQPGPAKPGVDQAALKKAEDDRVAADKVAADKLAAEKSAKAATEKATQVAVKPPPKREFVVQPRRSRAQADDIDRPPIEGGGILNSQQGASAKTKKD